MSLLSPFISFPTNDPGGVFSFPTVENYQYTEHSAGTSTTVSLPSSNEGDLMLVTFMADSALSLVSSGWTIVRSSLNDVGGITCYKVMGATPDSSIQFSHGTNKIPASFVHIISGFDNSNPISSSNVFGASSGANYPETLSLAEAKPGDLLLSMSGYQFLILGTYDTPPSGWTQDTIDETGSYGSTSIATFAARKNASESSESQGAWATQDDSANAAFEVVLAINPVSKPVADAEITVVGTETARGTGPQTLTLPAGTAEGDVVIAVAATRFGLPTTPAGGYTRIDDNLGSDPALTIAYKVMGATPDTDVTVGTSASAPTACLVMVFRGCDVNKVQDSVRTFSTGSSANPDSPSIDLISRDALIVSIAGLDNDSITSCVEPSGYSNLTWIGSSASLQTSNNASVMAATKWVENVASEDPGAFTTNGNDDWEAYTIALRPKITLV